MIDACFCKSNQNFDLCEILPANAEVFSDETARLHAWLAAERCGELKYMRRERCRFDHILKGARSVVVVGQYYLQNPVTEGVARYASGVEDYHVSLKGRLWGLLEAIREVHPEVRGRAVVDTAPILEKALARAAGFGWVGRNSLIINEKWGSFFNLGLLIVDVELGFGVPRVVADGCGECRRCVEACPMGAIGGDRMIDARRCISALTVERGRRGEQVREIHGWRHGCDVCQNVCPYNKMISVER